MFSSDRRLTYSVATAAILPGLVLCVLLQAPEWSPALGDHAFLSVVLPQERAHAARMDRALQDVAGRNVARQAITLELMHGRLTLLEAAAQMRDLDRAAPHFFWEDFRRAYPAASDDERHCLEAIAHLRGAFPPRDPAATEATRRYEEELSRHITQGTLHLPDPLKQP